jgi:nitrite reductase (NADH) small subunit
LDEETILGPLNLIPLGEGRRFEVRGTAVAVFHTRAGRVFATQADCPHQGGPLADGLVGGSTLICPLHERAFDLVTGAGIGQSCVLMTYPARITEDGAIGLRMQTDLA